MQSIVVREEAGEDSSFMLKLVEKYAFEQIKRHTKIGMCVSINRPDAGILKSLAESLKPKIKISSRLLAELQHGATPDKADAAVAGLLSLRPEAQQSVMEPDIGAFGAIAPAENNSKNAFFTVGVKFPSCVSGQQAVQSVEWETSEMLVTETPALLVDLREGEEEAYMAVVQR